MAFTNKGGRVVANQAEIERLMRGSEVRRDLGRRAEVGTQEAKRLCPTSPAGSDGNPSGHLRSSLGWTLGEDSKGPYADIGTDVEYALYVEFPTAPHAIDVVDASVLTDGSSFFGTHVDHPGTEAQPFLVPGLRAAERAN